MACGISEGKCAGAHACAQIILDTNVLAPRPGLRIRENNLINQRHSITHLSATVGADHSVRIPSAGWCATDPESHGTRKSRLRVVPATSRPVTYPLIIGAEC